ncbi:DUF932 domain-containing protein [Roseomonas sp. KE0001]|uniref:DUF932 domain-containing protein n=1 Tax=Roseomonas sp. KE0001 TaxID=2479201 RepID=UPI0018DEFBFA|nr:DUF932 domain-containing protein [Roseomonas sp. KE0001]MBI0435865.1 DUF945 domain-containing protein [Roseomonas sp. KE0001]
MTFFRPRSSFNIHQGGRSALSNEALSCLAPSAFATGKHESRSERYAYIATSEVIDGLRANGFLPVFAKQGRSRIEGKEAFTKHLIRFRYQGQGPALQRVGEVFPEVVLVNSHDGTSAYQLMAGMFRLACLNGMVVADRELATVKVAHKGDVVRQVIEGSYTVLEESKRALQAADEWAGVTLNQTERMIMAEAAHTLRFADEEGQTTTPVRPEQLLDIRRQADRSGDLWTTTNVVQENIIRGGLTAYGRDSNNRRRRVTTREVRGIDQDVKLNRALWVLAERMAELKGAAA